MNTRISAARTGDLDAASALPPTTSARALWTGRVLGGLFVAFMLMDATMKVLALPAAVEGTTALGYPARVIVPLGIVQLACLALYVVPRTALIGALLWTGYLGGAVATHVRVESPLLSHVLFPLYVAALLWGSLILRDPATRALLRKSVRW